MKLKAKEFIIKAHSGQVRKNEPEKPMVIHPLNVGKILEDYGYDDDIVIAGFLHDVIEDTKYTYEDIENIFGKSIASLVMGASESDKSLSWEERKKETIEKTKKLPLKNKVIICADKIDNLEDLALKFQRTQERDFSLFKRGEEKQKWYYNEVYKSLIYNEDESLPIFKRLKELLEIVFENKEDLFLKDVIFKENEEYYESLKKLSAQKREIKKLYSVSKPLKPYVIEFVGTPRSGKTTTIYNLYDFFKKGGFDVSVIDEFTTSKYYKDVFKKEIKLLNRWDGNIAILEAVYNELLEETKKGKDIILIDRSINDRLIWNHRCFLRGDVNKEEYEKIKRKYVLKSKTLIDFLVITYADSLISLKRDYNAFLALEQRNFLNIDNINQYNQCLKELESDFSKSVNKLLMVDTTDIDIKDASLEIAFQIMGSMKDECIKSLALNSK